jgi:NADH dehydrogenase
MIIRKICILGGSGFVGQTLANQLAASGYHLKVLSRRRESNRDNLIILPQLELIETDIHNQESLYHHFENCDAVINLIGILNERGRKGSGFHRAHVELVEKIIKACHRNNIRRILHMSALNADAEKGPSHYLRSKGEAEKLLFADSKLQVSCFRPSVIFGRNDSFFNRFAFLLKMTPLVFPLACAQARFAPVFVEDVAKAFVKSLSDPYSFGKHFCLCGPDSYTLRQLVEYTAMCLKLKRHVIPLTDSLSRLQAAVFDFVPGKPFSTDNYLSATVDSVCENNDLIKLGITPTALEGIVPQYLSEQKQRAHYQYYRRRAHRPSDL